jgi:hypothetical protein
MRSVRIVVLLALCAWMGAASAARAQAPYEPNDNVAQAKGPLAGGVDISAAIETDNDADWFVFYTSGQTVLDVSVTNTLGAGTVVCCAVNLYLLNSNGGQMGVGNAMPGITAHVRLTVPAAARYFLRAEGVYPETYQFRIDPASGVVAKPPGDIQPPGGGVPPAFGSGGVFVVPSNKACVSRRNFRIRIRQRGGVTLVYATVAVNGRRVAVRKGARLTAPVNLRGLPKGRFTVRISALTADGRAITGARRYRTCARRGPPNPPGPA